MKKIRVGIVSYLNTRPLVYGLKKEPIASEIELVEDTPARLAESLMAGEIDLGLVPVAVIPCLSQAHLVGEHCISTESEAASVCLFSEVPLAEIETVYLDYQSRTSVALLKWIMREYWNINPRLIQASDDGYRQKIVGTTAGLVIGDRAFEQRKHSTFFYDLGSEWRAITGLPFVFAVWVSTRKLDEGFIKRFDAANALGMDHLDEIIAANPYELFDLRKYYTLHLNYRLNDKKRKAIELFLESIHDQV